MATLKIPRICENCGNPFTKISRPDQRFCRNQCHQRWRYGSDLCFGDRFRRNFEVSLGCWEWIGERTDSGYGLFRIIPAVRKSRVRAHVLSCTIHNGPAPSDKPFACHHCDNPPCVRGDHLFWGSREDNFDDMRQKGRARGGSRPGEMNYGAILTEAMVLDARQRNAKGESPAMMVSDYPVSLGALQKAVYRKTWRHI